MRDEAEARRAAEREAAALHAEKRELERRLISAHRTLAYGLGRAIIELRTLKGIATFPAKIRRLRLKQKAKRRERVPDRIPAGIAETLKLVDPALAVLHADGPDTAISWVRGQSARPDAKARALVEIALRIAPENPGMAEKLASEARSVALDESRLAALTAMLGDSGRSASTEDVSVVSAEYGLEPGRKAVLVAFGEGAGNGAALFWSDFAQRIGDKGDVPLIALIGPPQDTHRFARLTVVSKFHPYIRHLGQPAPGRWPALFARADLLLCMGWGTRPEPVELPLFIDAALRSGLPCAVEADFAEKLPETLRENVMTIGKDAQEIESALMHDKQSIES